MPVLNMPEIANDEDDLVYIGTQPNLHRVATHGLQSPMKLEWQCMGNRHTLLMLIVYLPRSSYVGDNKGELLTDSQLGVLHVLVSPGLIRNYTYIACL